MSDPQNQPMPAPSQSRSNLPLMVTTAAVLLAVVGILLLSRGNDKATQTPRPPPTPAEVAQQAVDYSEQFKTLIQNKGDIATAILPDIRRLAEAHPDCFEAQLLLGQVYITLDQMDLAYPPVERALAIRPEGHELTKMLATLAYQSAKPNEAIRLYQLVISRCTNPIDRGQARAMLAAVLTHQQQLDEADATYQKALKDNPLLIPAHLAFIELALIRQRPSDALDRVESGLIWAGQDPKADLSPFLAAKARAELALGQVVEARQTLNGIGGKAGSSNAVARAWGDYYEKSGHPELGADAWEEWAQQLALPLDGPPSSSAALTARLKSRIQAHQEAARLYQLAGQEAQAHRHLEQAAQLEAKG